MRLKASPGMAAGGGLSAAIALLLAWRFPQVPAVVVAVLLANAAMLLLLALLYRGQREQPDPATTPLRRRYLRELLGSMAVYMLVLFASIWLLQRIDAPMLRALTALLPVVPIAFSLRAMIRYIRDTDEMQQRIELESVSIATGFVSMLYMTGGFLQMARVIDVPSGMAMIWVFPMACFSYGVAKTIVARRYQ